MKAVGNGYVTVSYLNQPDVGHDFALQHRLSVRLTYQLACPSVPTSVYISLGIASSLERDVHFLVNSFKSLIKRFSVPNNIPL